MKQIALSALTCAFLFFSGGSLAKPQQVGVVILHGKQGVPEGAFSPINKLYNVLTQKGYWVVRPEMPWSRKRYLEGDWQQAMTEIGVAVDQLRAKGAQKIVIAGHSIGSPAALSYAVQSQVIDGVAMMAPGHVPILYSECLSRVSLIAMCAVKTSIDDARQAIAAGKGDEQARYTDINQGASQMVLTTAKAFLSYFDPAGEAEMSVTAKKLPSRTAVLWIIGYQDSLIKLGPDYVFKLLPQNPQNKYLEIPSNHFRTPVDGLSEIVKWIDSIADF